MFAQRGRTEGKSMALSPDLQDLLALHLVPGLGPRLTAALLERFGSAGAVLRAAPDQLQQVPHIGGKLAGDLHHAMRAVDIEAEQELIARFQVSLFALGAPGYPPPLADISDPPHLLYVRGAWETRDANAVALVGSRHGTAYGRRVAERLAEGLVRAGFTVVSGLARGIDSTAHRAALKAGGRTLAVLANGLSKVYPPEHADLADEIQRAGALFSEAAMAMDPMAGMFPARNRIISGLSRGVVVIEAAQRSGALITASHAAEQGRTVFAVPGPVDSAASGGVNELLRKGAILVRGVEDILQELEGVASPACPTRPQPPPALDPTEQRVWESLADQPRHIDDLTRQLVVPIPELTRTLMLLEMKKVIRRLPGNLYERR
jgi:DNA processing protein